MELNKKFFNNLHNRGSAVHRNLRDQLWYGHDGTWIQKQVLNK